MNFIFSNNIGEEIEKTSLNELVDILNLPYEYWLEGTGDTSIKINEEEQIILIKLNTGFFIMYHPDYLSPIIDDTNTEEDNHFVGGEKMVIPRKFLCNFDQAKEILWNYIFSKELDTRFSWLEVYQD